MQFEMLDIYYIRLSREDGDVTDGSEAESCSIHSQREYIQRYLAYNNMSPEKFIEISDDGYSGTTMNRPGMNQIIEWIGQGRVRTIVVRDLSRFARNYLEAGHYLEFVFPENHIRFISINDNYDSDKIGETTGGLDLAVKNLLNQMYSRDISKKIKSAVDIKKMNGEYAYTNAPYGYKKGAKKNTLAIDEPAAVVVRRIFALASQGSTITEIAQILNNECIPTPSAYAASSRGNYPVFPSWSYESVRYILNNRIYTGDMVPFKSRVTRVGGGTSKKIPEDQQIIIPNTHEAIIDRALFNTVHDSRKHYAPRRTDPDRKPFLFRSLLVCGCCGKKLLRGKAQNKDWLCATRRYDTSAACKDVRANDALLTGIVLRSIQVQTKLLDSRIKYVRQSKRMKKTEEQVLQEECKRLRKEIEDCQTEKMEHYERFVSGELSKNDFLTLKSDISVQEEAAKAQLNLAQNKLNLLNDQMQGQALQIFSGQKYVEVKEAEELTADLVKLMVKQITVFPDGHIKIIWNYNDEVSALMEQELGYETDLAM